MWIVIVLIVLGVIGGILVFRTRRGRTPPRDTYVCDVCGQKECVCHKEERRA
jgi:hypothetical protein